jgi:PTH1 family peptidyl-tRNA hydrolase
VGLGNPGPSYAGHRHNVGYLVADELAARMGSSFRAHKSGRADVVEGRLGAPGTPSPRHVLARARSYMNESGGPIKQLATFYKVPAERIVAIHDELDIPFDTMRVKLGGGDNGHNGLRSLRGALGTGDFYRVRVGIGRPPGRQEEFTERIRLRTGAPGVRLARMDPIGRRLGGVGDKRPVTGRDLSDPDGGLIVVLDVSREARAGLVTGASTGHICTVVVRSKAVSSAQSPARRHASRRAPGDVRLSRP